MKVLRIAGISLAVVVGGTCSGAHAGGTEDAGSHVLSPTPVTHLTAAAGKATQAEVDAAGWQMFVAFNWPARKGQRGVPDPHKKFGSPGPVVWETWKSPDEVFYPDGSKPPPWPVYGTQIPRECFAIGARSDGSTAPVLTRTLIDRTNQAAGGSLTDQNGNLVYYSIAFNKQVFDFIYDNGYYSRAGQSKLAGPVNYPAATAEMKASWRILLPSEPEAVKRRFLRRTVFLYTPAIESNPPTCSKHEVGLIGQHFNLKIRYPDDSLQWLMATFEQVDNVPPFGTPYKPGKDDAHTLPYSLFNKKCYTTECTYNQSTEQGRSPTTPTEAIRMVNIDPAAQTLNPQWQQLFKQVRADSPWQYYQMVTTQYPADPSQQPVGAPTPAYSANTTMETYVRQSSCLNCHFTAKDINAKYFADYSFMLAQVCPKPLFPPPHAAGADAWKDGSAACAPTTVDPTR